MRPKFTLTAEKLRLMAIIRQEYGQYPQKWQESTDFIDQEDARVVCNQPQHSRTKASHPKRKSEKQPGNHANTTRHQLLSIHQDSGKRGREDKANDHG
ncbi:hypothetical protein D3C72_1971920 [compost metagenome]